MLDSIDRPPIVLTRDNHDRLSALAAAASHAPGSVGEFLAYELERAEVVEPCDLPPDVITMNSRAEYRDEENGECRAVTLVYPGSEDIAEGRISIFTPIGAALIGLSCGQSIVWETRRGTKRRLVVTRVMFQPEAQARAG